MQEKIRHAAWAGQFYPGNKTTLNRMIDEYLNSAPSIDDPGNIVGFAVPHAGYVYSGPTAAAAYKQIMGRDYDTVIVIAPSHAELIHGISVYNGDFYETVFGKVAIDKELSAKLTAMDPTIYLSEDGHRSIADRAEHSLEVQLPFLQKSLNKDFKLVAIVFHDYSYKNCRLLGETIGEHLADKKILIVASSDLYHGYSYTQCKETDDHTLKSIESMNVEEFCHGINSHAYQACGGGPIASLLVAAQKMGDARAQVIARTCSADVTGATEGWVVGYASILVTI